MRVYTASSCMRAFMYLGIPGRTIRLDAGRPRSERAHQSWMPVTAQMAAQLRRGACARYARRLCNAACTPLGRYAPPLHMFSVGMIMLMHSAASTLPSRHHCCLEIASGVCACRHAEWTWRCCIASTFARHMRPPVRRNLHATLQVRPSLSPCCHYIPHFLLQTLVLP